MGRIKTQNVKRVTNELMLLYGERFKADFTENKPIVTQLLEVKSKKILNTVTGYVTRLAKKKGSY